jgi:hypothetical protein
MFLKHTLPTVMLALLGAGITGCSKMNDLHDRYLKEGETIYVSRIDTASVTPGRNRASIRYVNLDPKVARLLVYWRTRQDSAIFDVPVSSMGDTLTAVIENLPEDSYNFELVTMNKESKYPSIPYETSGKTYGEKFQATLLDRPVIAKELVDEDNTLTIKWARAPQFAVENELTYRNVDGETVRRKVPLSEALTVLTDVAGDVEYRTLFLPEAKAIDTFTTGVRPLEPVIVLGEQLNKTLFKRWNPTGIPYTGNTTAAWRIENAWDRSITLGFANNNAQFTFDMGQLAELSRLHINNRKETDLVFNHSHMRKFQVWGSAVANVTADYAGWTLLGQFESLKPSGAPTGTVTADDIQYAHIDGEKFYFPDTLPAVRYLRIVCQETWGRQAGIQFMELTLTGVVK